MTGFGFLIKRRNPDMRVPLYTGRPFATGGLHGAVLGGLVLLALTGCKNPVMPISSACGVIKASLYDPDGTFTLTDTEVDAMRAVTQEKIIAIKNFYRNHCLKKT